MNILESFRVALTALQSNKLRAFLTMLGIIIGVGAVIGLLAIGAGFRQFLDQQISSGGVGVFYVVPFVNSKKADAVQSAQLTAADAEALRVPGAVPAVKDVAVQFSGGGAVSAGKQRASYDINGISPSYFTISTNTLGVGRYFSDDEERSSARVAVVGLKVAEKLFGGMGTAVGARITIEGVGFEVVGVLTTKSGDGPNGDPQEQVFVPYQTAKERLFRNQLSPRVDLSSIVVQARDRDQVEAAIAQATALLRARHRLTYQDNDFTIISLDQIAATVGAILGGFNAFLAIVGGISLLVGGIGIMNIMLVSVTERTREIGLRKAVGARRRDIMAQFLVEAAVLALVGGAFGVLVGYTLSFVGTFVLVNLFQAEGATASVQPASVLLATGVAAAVGLIFGFFPALQAARMNPIEALRYE